MSLLPDNTISAAPADHRVAYYVRAGWRVGGVADDFISSVLFVLGMIFYVTSFKMPAGLALAVPRFVDAIKDSINCNLSDNLRTRFGRRRPMIAVGAIGSATLLPLIWFPPMLETVQYPWYSNVPFWYLAISGSVYFIFYTLFMVPYTVLGFELTDDYDERTRVLAWRMYLGLAASMTVPAFYYFCRLPVFGEGVTGEITGTRWVSLALAVVVLITGLIPVFVTRERPEASIQPTTPIIHAIKQTLSNGPFLILSIAYIAVIVGLFTGGTLGTFALIYYVFQASDSIDLAKDQASMLGMLAGILAALTAYLSMHIAARISRLTGKRIAMTLGLFFMLVGTLSIWFLYDPALLLNATDFIVTQWIVGLFEWLHAVSGGWINIPVNAEALKVGVLLAVFIGSLGGQGCWLMIDSMTADICDEDELRTGLRREGMFSAAQGFGRKIAFAFTVLVGGYLLQWAGLRSRSGGKGRRSFGPRRSTDVDHHDRLPGRGISHRHDRVCFLPHHPPSRRSHPRSARTPATLSSPAGDEC